MNMLVRKDHVGFDLRSWRYRAIISNGAIEKMFIEEGFSDNGETAPYGASSPWNSLVALRAGGESAAA